jgi:hypothetical protein
VLGETASGFEPKPAKAQQTIKAKRAPRQTLPPNGFSMLSEHTNIARSPRGLREAREQQAATLRFVK